MHQHNCPQYLHVSDANLIRKLARSLSYGDQQKQMWRKMENGIWSFRFDPNSLCGLDCLENVIKQCKLCKMGVI